MPYQEVRIRVAVVGTGAKRLVEQFVTGKDTTGRTAPSPRTARRVVDGVPVYFAVGTSDAFIKQGAAAFVVSYNVKMASPAASVRTAMAQVPEGAPFVLAGSKGGEGGEGGEGGGDVVKNMSEVGRSHPEVSHFVVSERGENIDAVFEAVARRHNLATLRVELGDLRAGARLTPREVGARYAGAWASAQERAHRYTKHDAPVFVVLSDKDLKDILVRKEKIPPGVINDVVLWLPAAKVTGRAATEFVRRKEQANRAFFHGGNDHGTMRRGLAEGLCYGILPDMVDQEFTPEALAATLSRVESFPGARRLVPWERVASASQFLDGVAAGRAVAHVQTRRGFGHTPTEPMVAAHAYPVWASGDHVREAVREQLELATFDVVEVGDGIPAGRSGYDFSSATKLGQGAFGCVVRVARGNGLPDAALKVQGLAHARGSQKPTTGALRDALHEVAIAKHVQRAVVDLGAMTPYVLPMFDGYITNPIPGILKRPRREDFLIEGKFFIAGDSRSGQSSEEAIRQAIDLGIVVESMCNELKRENLVAGMVVTEMPVAGLGDINKEAATKEATEAQRRAWAFQLFHGLAAMNSGAGFVHQDIKPDNVLVFRNSDLGGATSRHLRVRRRNPDDGTVEDVYVHDTSPTVALLADFGLSMSQHATLFGRNGPSFESVNGDQMHRNGTLNYTDPVMGVYFNPELDDEAINERYTGSFRERGVAGDVWALGLVLLNVWMQDDAIGKRPEGRTGAWVRSRTTMLVGIDEGVSEFLTQMIKKVGVGYDRPDHNYVEVAFTSENPEKSGFSYAIPFLHSLALYYVFNGNKWPTVTTTEPAPGPYWKYLEDHWAAFKVATKVPRRAYKHVVGNLLREQENVYDFIKQCLAWDPEDRARFLLDGRALMHAMFNDAEATMLHVATPDEIGAGNAPYMLDLTVPIVREEAEASVSPQPATPKPIVVPTPAKPKPSVPKPVVLVPAPEVCPLPDDPEPVEPATEPEACKEIKNVVVINVEDHSTYNAIVNVEQVADANSLYVFDFDDTLATRPDKVFRDDANAEEKLRTAASGLGDHLMKFGNGDYYGPGNIRKLLELKGRVVVLTSRNMFGAGEVRNVLTGVGLGDVQVISSGRTSKSSAIRKLLDEKTANIVHFIDNSKRHRRDVRDNVTVGANALHIYPVSLKEYIHGRSRFSAHDGVKVLNMVVSSPAGAIRDLAKEPSANDVYIIDFEGVLAAREGKLLDPDDLTRRLQNKGADDTSEDIVRMVADARIVDIEVIGSQTEPGRLVSTKVYGPTNIRNLKDLQGDVYIVGDGSTDENFIRKIMEAQGVERFEVVNGVPGETKGQTVARILEDKTIDTAHVMVSQRKDVVSVARAVTKGNMLLRLYNVDIGTYVRRLATHEVL